MADNRVMAMETESSLGRRHIELSNENNGFCSGDRA